MKKSRILTTLKKFPFENIVRKGENCWLQAFLLFPPCFQPYQEKFISATMKLPSGHAFELVKDKLLYFGTDSKS